MLHKSNKLQYHCRQCILTLQMNSFIYELLQYCYVQVNEQLSPVWSTFLTISLRNQYTQLNSACNMNNTNEVVIMSVIALNWVSQVTNGLLLKWPKNKIHENIIIATGTLSSNTSIFWP